MFSGKRSGKLAEKKRRRICAGVAALLSAAFLTACGSAGKIPEGMDEETYQAGVQAAEAVKAYQDGEIEKEEASERLQDAETKLEGISLEDGSDAYMANMVISLYTSRLLSELEETDQEGVQADSSSSAGDELQEQYEKLTDALDLD